MLFDQAAKDPTLSYEMAKLITILRGPNPNNTLFDACERLKPGCQGLKIVQNTGNAPTYAGIRWPEVSIILIDGVTVIEQALSYVQALHEAPNYSDSAGANAYCVDKAFWIRSDLIINGDYLRPRMIVAGHSMGGATAHVLVQKWLMNNNYTNVSLITYGSPKAGPAVFAEQMKNLDIARWMATDDPVPNVPPYQSQCPIWWMTTNANARSACNSYCHTLGGITISETGVVAAQDRPDFPTIDVTVSLASWLYFCATSTNNYHSCPAYVSRLLAYKQAIGLRPVRQGGTTHRGEAIEMPTREARRLADEEARTLAAQQAVKSQEATVIPNAARFRAVRVGVVWVTQLDGQTISVGPTRSKASSLASRGNSFLRKLQRTARLDTNAMLVALKGYLAEASNPTSAFRPTLND